ncbi:hypothetical protein MRX96_007361 [Rhipicephalus microplus]
MRMPQNSGCCRTLQSRLLRLVVAVFYWCLLSAQLSYYSHATMRARFSGGSAEVFWLKSATVMLKIPSSVATYLSVWRLGRRSALWLLLCLLSLMARMAAVMLAVRGYHDNAAIFLYALTGVLVNQFVMLLFPYSVEVFPTDTSGAAMSVVDFCGRLGAPSKPVLRPLFRFAGLGGGTVADVALLSLMADFASFGALLLPATMSLGTLKEDPCTAKRSMRPPPAPAETRTVGAR